MSDTAALSLPQAARHFGVSVRVLRGAIRAGRLPAPPQLTAVSLLPPDWVAHAEREVAASPKVFAGIVKQKAPAFARYSGTSAWHKFGRRVHAYAQFRAASE